MFLLHHKGTIEGPETLKLLELEGVRVCVSLCFMRPFWILLESWFCVSSHENKVFPLNTNM